jgi:pyrroloquinoline quinone (PQQ) biosynthesis protein C
MMNKLQSASGTLSDSATSRVERLAGSPPNQVLEIVELFEHSEQITRHPFMERLAREAPNLRHLWLLLKNFQISISRHFARRLAGIAGRVEDDRIRCILAEQLNDEMGRGKFERAHVNLFTSMMSQLAPWKPDTVDDRVLAPGLHLDPRLADIYEAEDVFFSLGAVMAGEVFGKQMDQFIGDQFRRQSEIDAGALEWLALHEELEVAHADESAELARLVPQASLSACWRGACALSSAGWEFLDDLYVLCYGSEHLI